MKVKATTDEKSSGETIKLQASITALQNGNKDLKSHLKRLESHLDSHMGNTIIHNTPSKSKKVKSSSTGKSSADDSEQ